MSGLLKISDIHVRFVYIDNVLSIYVYYLGFSFFYFLLCEKIFICSWLMSLILDSGIIGLRIFIFDSKFFLLFVPLILYFNIDKFFVDKNLSSVGCVFKNLFLSYVNKFNLYVSFVSCKLIDLCILINNFFDYDNFGLCLYDVLVKSFCCNCNFYLFNYFFCSNFLFLYIPKFFSCLDVFIYDRYYLLVICGIAVVNCCFFVNSNICSIYDGLSIDFLRLIYGHLFDVSLFRDSVSVLFRLRNNLVNIINFDKSFNKLLFGRICSSDRLVCDLSSKLSVVFFSGLRGCCVNGLFSRFVRNKYILKIDFKSYFSSIYLYYWDCFFSENILFDLKSVMFNIFKLRNVCSIKNFYFKKFLNFFYGNYWNIGNFGAGVSSIGEIILFRCLLFLESLGYTVVECNVDHFILLLDKSIDYNVIVGLLSKFLSVDLGLPFLFSVCISSVFGLVDYNNGVMLDSDGKIIGRGSLGYSSALLKRDISTHNVILNVYACLGLDMSKLSISDFFYFVLKDGLLVRLIPDFFDGNSFLQFFKNCSVEVFVAICKFFLFRFGIFCFGVVGKKQPVLKINVFYRFIKKHILYYYYWLYLFELNLVKYYCSSICLAVYCGDSIIALDYDYMIDDSNYLQRALSLGSIMSIAPSGNIKLFVLKDNFSLVSKKDNFEVLENRWVNIYGSYFNSDDRLFGYYCFLFGKDYIGNINDLLLGLNDLESFVVKRKAYRYNDGLINKPIKAGNIYFFGFKDFFVSLLKQELLNVGSKVFCVYVLENNYSICRLKIDIVCGSHSYNHQAYCYVSVFNSNEFISNVSISIACAGNRCSINYSSVRYKLLEALK